MLCFVELGCDWAVASTDDNDEYRFINQGHISDYHQETYFVGGRTEDFPNGTVRLSQNFGFAENGNIFYFFFKIKIFSST